MSGQVILPVSTDHKFDFIASHPGTSRRVGEYDASPFKDMLIERDIGRSKSQIGVCASGLRQYDGPHQARMTSATMVL